MKARLSLACLFAIILFTPINVQAAAFNFNWVGTPSSPLSWTPGAINDWDLIATNDYSTDSAGTMQAQHGADCSSPPAVHTISVLGDSSFICNNHMMTAIYGGGDASKSYAAVYFAPAQLVDFSASVAQINWQVSTQRQADRDWWDLWLTPFSENLVVPLQNLPAFNGPPKDALHFTVDNGACTINQAFGGGSIVKMIEYRNFQEQPTITEGTCIEDGAGGVSAITRAPFELDISTGHSRLWMPGSNLTLAQGDTTLPFSKAVVQWSHQSYDPDKVTGQTPNTFHWSNVSIAPSIPFTMLRPNGINSVHAGTPSAFVLPQPAPINAFLRFAAIGSIQVSLNGGAFQPVIKQMQAGPGSDGVLHDEQMSNYWMLIPVGTTSIAIQGQDNQYGQAWWIQDVSVWAN